VSNKIIQSDNAVIDYTTISVMIDTLNNQQKAIEDLQALNVHSAIKTNADGTTTTVTGTKTVQGNHLLVTGNGTYTVKFDKPFNSQPTSVVGTILTTTGAKAGCILSKTIANDSAQFTVFGLSGTSGVKGTYLYWMAIGI
jgi:hypothetical protein